MSIHIHLIDPPDSYTNLDTVSGQVGFTLSRPESVGAVVVKLEGEASTTLVVPMPDKAAGWTYRNTALDDTDAAAKDPAHPRPSPGAELKETHKILYQVMQAYPPKMGDGEKKAATTILQAGHHTFPFQFELPFNNTCANPSALSRSHVGLGDTSGIRVMNGTKQLLLRHMRQTLPPSFGESSGQVEMRYFVKVTVQRPGLFKENWRHQLGFRFMPIEPPRPPPTTREVFARRPFAFRARAAVPLAIAPVRKKGSGFFGRGGGTSSVGLTLFEAGDQLTVAAPTPREFTAGTRSETGTGRLQDGLAPAIQMSALLPFPAILTCGQAVPLRLTARKLQPSRELVYLTGLEVRLVGTTRLVAQDLRVASKTSWVLLARTDLAIAVCTADGPVDAETELPDELWRSKTLPSTVVPNFRICNASREYELEVRITLSWGLPSPATSALRAYPALSPTASKQEKKTRKDALKALQAQPAQTLPQTVRFPLNFAAVEVYSGIRPTAALVAAVSRHLELQGLQEQRQLRQHQQVRDEDEDADSYSDSGDSDNDGSRLHLREMGQGQQHAGIHEMPLPRSRPLEAVELPALPPRNSTGATRQMTIRRRPVPQAQEVKNSNGTLCDRPQQQYHLYQQQTDPQPQPQPQAQPQPQRQTQRLLTAGAFDPLYPPQLQAGLDDDEDAYDDPPPTYDEAMTSVLDLGGGVGSDRPAGRSG